MVTEKLHVSGDATAPTLPPPDAIAQVHSDKLRQLIQQRIRDAGGLLSFADYMAAALYEPGLGYYMAGAAKFGAQGDFITAPEVSPLFGQAVAAQICAVIHNTGGGILELGAGSGKLALSIMRYFETRNDLYYSILEPSAELAHRQQQLLSHELPAEVFGRVQWLDTLPVNFTGVVLANEVMDALPVERFHIDRTVKQGRVQQLWVNENLQSEARPAGDDLSKAIGLIENDIGELLPGDYESEICPLLAPWIASLEACLRKGVLLLIDYGYPRREYYLPERKAGTLSCYYQHRVHDNPYVLPGLQDITAHVDFTHVVEAGMACNLELLGYTSQSAFLLSNGVLDFADARQAQMSSEADRLMVAKEVKTLTLPGEMGERFQAMALGKGYDHPLSGFQSQDLSYRL